MMIRLSIGVILKIFYDAIVTIATIGAKKSRTARRVMSVATMPRKTRRR